MATFVPLLRDILPMIMPSSVHIQKAPPRPQTPPPTSSPLALSAPVSGPPPPPVSTLAAEDPTIIYNLPQPSPFDAPGDAAYPPVRLSPGGYAPAALDYDYARSTGSPYLRVGSPDSDGPRLGRHRVEDEGDLEGLDYSDDSGPPTPDYRNKEIPGQSALRVTNQLVNRNDYMCASALELDAHSHTSIRHHGEQETIIFVISGTLVLSTKSNLEEDPQTHVVTKGDFICIPPWTEHQLHNNTDDPASWLAMRNAAVPITVDLVDWGEEEIEPLVTDSD